MKRFFLAIGFLFLAVGCGKIDNSTGGTPNPAASVKTLGITSDKTSITSNGLDTATLTIRAIDANNVVVSGAEVTLTASAGALGENTVTTDVAGKAIVSFDSGLDTANQPVIISASSGRAVTTTTVNIIGTTVELTASQASVLLNGVSTSTLTVVVRDSGGNPLPNFQVTLTSSGLGTLTNLATQQTGLSITLATNSQGQASARYSAGNVPGIETITLTSAAGEKTVSINVTSSQFTLADDTEGSPISLDDGTANVTLTWIDASGTPFNNQSVTFSVNQGHLGDNQPSLTLKTNPAGQATVTFTPSVAGPATVTVRDVTGAFSANLTINVQAVNATSVSLQVAPSVIARADEASTPTATLTATVRDAFNNVVANKDVTFSIVAGPGGGERIDPVVSRTNAGGVATATFFSGNQTSAQKGVVVKASITSTPTINGTATLTIGQQAARIQFGTTNVISIENVNSLEVNYALPITLLVTDNNGNPIPNQDVSLGLYPLKFISGTYLDFGDPTTAIFSAIYDNEDLNRNGILDPGEDGSTGYLGEDLNRNGTFDTRLNEDLNSNGTLDTCWDEDINGNGSLDATVSEDTNNNNFLDYGVSEDLNDNGVLDLGEDFNDNGVLDTGANEDRNGNGVLDPGEDFNNNGRLDTLINEDVNNNGVLDPGEDFNDNLVLDSPVDEDLNQNGRLDPGEDFNGNSVLDTREDLNGNNVLDTGITEDINGNQILDSCVNEDLNGNLVLDTVLSEDLNQNGVFDSLNGRLDPGNVATIPTFVTTDINGFAAFNVIYPKSYGNWVRVELSASTSVSGNLATARLVETLAVAESDAPYLPSPFNLIPE